MCIDPITAVGIGLTVAQSAVSFGAASEDYNNRASAWRQNYTNSLSAGRDEQRQLSFRMLQEEESFKQKEHQNSLEAAEVSAEAEAAGAAAGVAGISLDNIMVDIGRQAEAKRYAEKTNYENTIQQLTTEMEATNTTIQSRINSVQRPTAPNPIGYVLQGVGGALKAIPQGE